MAMQDRLNTTLYTAKPSAIRAFSALAAQTPGCVRLTLGEPDFDTPAPVCRAAGEALQNGETHYIANTGDPALREKIAAFEAAHNGMDYAPEEIIVTAGATEALFTALFGVLDPGDEVIVPSPAFVLYEQIVNLCRAVYVPLDTAPDGFQIDGKKLAALITPKTKAIVLNSPNNPTGCVYDARSLAAVYDAVRGRDIFVVCDDVYRQLCYSGEYHSFAEYRDLRPQLLVAQSFSKPYAMTGWRMGYLLGDRPVMEKLALVHQFAVVSTPAPFQRAAMAALEYDPAPMLAEYARRRTYVLGRLRGMGLPVNEPQGAFYAFPSIEGFSLPSAVFCTRLIREAGVAVTPGFCFGAEGYIRISYCCAPEQLALGLDRLEGFIRGLRGGDKP